MSKLITLNGEDSQFLEKIFSEEVLVYEDIQASKIWINWDGKSITIKPKSVSSDPLNLVDLAIQNYYNPAINYFQNLEARVKGLMPKNWSFCFEFFPDNQPANIVYERLPKNNLVLTCIWKSGKYEYNVDELLEFSRLFDVDCLPIIFQGNLTEEMKEAIKYFLSTSEGDLEYVFGEKSFAYFFYKILNPASENSFLMEGDFQKNLQKIIIRANGDQTSFEILNPLYERISGENSTEFTDVYTLILVNFLNFCQSVSIEDIKIKGERKDESYIYLICKLFNMYISDVKEDISNFEFTIPEFFNKEKFKINKELIRNKLTREIIEESEKLEYVFKVVLGSFNKKKKKPIGIFSQNTVDIFNKFVDKIDHLIDNHLGKIREVEISKAGLVDFGEFLDIKYDVDGQGEVYPEVWDDIQAERDTKKKSKTDKLPKK
jgi:hypothetical protein